MGDNSLVNWRLEPQHCKEHAHMVVVLPKKIVAEQSGVTKKKSSPFEYVVVWAPQMVKVHNYTVKIYRKLKPTIGMITYRNTVL